MFWNLAKNNVSRLLASACEDNNVDILVLAECIESSSEILISLNGNISQRVFREYKVVDSYVRVFVRYDLSCFKALYDDGRSSIREFRPPVGLPLLLVFCHLPSKLYKDDKNQHFVVRGLVNEIYRCEDRLGHSNTLVIGDLNINPYEDAMIAADGFHATMDKRIAMRVSRNVNGKKWKFFFNPCWNLLGDESSVSPGTFYYNNGGDIFNLYWNFFDQCLLRPNLLTYYTDGCFQIIHQIRGRSLLSKTTTDRSISDHLPIKIYLDTERYVP